MPGESIALPLFPLHTVLLPGMTLPLRIFEPRYLQMIEDCLDADRVFGVLLIKEGHEVGEAALPYDVGTTARIVAVERTSANELHIVTVGEERFLVHSISREGKPYLVGEVELIPLEERETPRATSLHQAPWAPNAHAA